MPSGGPWGGTCVDREYLDFLEDLFGHDVWSEFIKAVRLDLPQLFVGGLISYLWRVCIVVSNMS
jgi:hypothetical protein